MPRKKQVRREYFSRMEKGRSRIVRARKDHDRSGGGDIILRLRNPLGTEREFTTTLQQSDLLWGYVRNWEVELSDLAGHDLVMLEIQRGQNTYLDYEVEKPREIKDA